MQHLSGMDASFLHLETPETPMHVGSLMLFDLPKGYKGDYCEDVKALIGKRVLITAGPTFEPIDPVRGITNRSSGKMGFAMELILRPLIQQLLETGKIT